jgi:hypothetical protein
LPEIDQLTLWEVNDLMSYWQDYPPTHVLVGAYLMRGSKRSKRGETRDSKLDELAQAISSVGGNSKGKLPDIYRR